VRRDAHISGSRSPPARAAKLIVVVKKQLPGTLALLHCHVTKELESSCCCTMRAKSIVASTSTLCRMNGSEPLDACSGKNHAPSQATARVEQQHLRCETSIRISKCCSLSGSRRACREVMDVDNHFVYAERPQNARGYFEQGAAAISYQSLRAVSGHRTKARAELQQKPTPLLHRRPSLRPFIGQAPPSQGPNLHVQARR